MQKLTKKQIDLSDFYFEFSGYGHYKVTYTSPSNAKKWSKTITDMQLIDATKNSDCPKIADLKQLKKLCKK